MKDRNVIITPVKNGPNVVEGLEEITSASGKKHTNDKKSIALCRCGGSSNKPFCDGTHGKTGFTSDKDADRQPRKEARYEGEKIVIYDDRGVCSHAGYCTGGLPEVFNMDQEPWINPDGAKPETIKETIEKCPSGALAYEIDGLRYQGFADKPVLKIAQNGPNVFEGIIEFKGEADPPQKGHAALCRCGASKNKPRCDGTHHEIGFKDEGEVGGDPTDKPWRDTPFDNRISRILNLAKTARSEMSPMRTLETFPDFKQLLFKGAQLDTMPLNEEEAVELKTIIGKHAEKPLTLSLPFYVSHMSFGALSKEAKIALAEGSAQVDTATCSGEGGMLKEEKDAAKHYIYEQGTAYFSYDEDVMKKASAVELKIGQAVKPGTGAHLPAEKVTAEIAETRGIKPHRESVSPARLAGVNSIEDLKKRVDRIRKITGGVPVGIKLSAGHIEADIEKALEAGPDFITLDCRGGGTGGAYTFLKDNVGVPPVFAISRARKVLDEKKSTVSLVATGGFRDASDIAKGLALGADAIAMATASMIAIGCIQSRNCDKGTCPVGVATQDEGLRKLLDTDVSATRYVNFATATAEELKTFARSNGKDNIHDLSTDDLSTTSREISMHTPVRHV